MKKMLLLIFICMMLYACKTNDAQDQMVGNDRDTHGCIPSAGYNWCEKTQQCERPWELAKQQGFENTQEAFNAFCKNN